ncbi:MAG: hypothetical protein P8170_15265 [Gemmatimonadota bacterium]|jgi:hypothetical protein
MTVEQIDQALHRLVAHERARLAARAVASLKQQSKAAAARYAEAERHLEDTEDGSGGEAKPDEGFTA